MDLNKIYNMDCMEGMKQFPDKFFELAIVDPPYGIGVNVSMGRRKGDKKSPYHKFAGEDKSIPGKEYFDELFRVSNNQIIWGGNYFISKIPNDSPCWIVWDKDNSGDFADCELAYTSFKSSVRKFKWRWNGMLQEKMGNEKEERIHPTQKPVALYKWLLSKYAKPGDKILDTHVGSASSLIACIDMGFDFVGFELDTDYYASAAKRMEQFKAQTKLFT